MIKNLRYTVDDATLELYKYDYEDEDVNGFECFEDFDSAQQYLITLVEMRLNDVSQLQAKDIR